MVLSSAESYPDIVYSDIMRQISKYILTVSRIFVSER